MQRVISKCVITPKYTAMAAALWLLLPASGIVWLFNVIGPDPQLLYLAGVTLLPASLALLAPWLRVWLEARKDISELREVKNLARPLRQLQSPQAADSRLSNPL